jgi:hypothetical protein
MQAPDVPGSKRHVFVSNQLSLAYFYLLLVNRIYSNNLPSTFNRLIDPYVGAVPDSSSVKGWVSLERACTLKT